MQLVKVQSRKKRFLKKTFSEFGKTFWLPFLRGRENCLWRLPDSMEQISPSRTVRGFRGFAVNSVVFVRIAQPSRSRITLLYGWDTDFSLGPLLDGRHLRSVIEEETVSEGPSFLSHRKTLFRGAAEKNEVRN